jgi:hypothetical protein
MHSFTRVKDGIAGQGNAAYGGEEATTRGSGMNRFLASSIGYLNGLLAVIIILAGGFGARSMALSAGAVDAAGAALIGGLLLGLVVAVLLCGVLAIFVDIRREVVAIRELLSKEKGTAA